MTGPTPQRLKDIAEYAEGVLKQKGPADEAAALAGMTLVLLAALAARDQALAAADKLAEAAEYATVGDGWTGCISAGPNTEISSKAYRTLYDAFAAYRRARGWPL